MPSPSTRISSGAPSDSRQTISVDSRGMLEILRKIFDAKEIADELTK